MHSSGLHYEWDGAPRPIAGAPAWLIAKASERIAEPFGMLEAGTLKIGERDARLYSIAARWRREGATLEQITPRLRALNRRICIEPVKESQILKIARSAVQIAVGGLDPLEAACVKVLKEGHHFGSEKVLAVVRHLHAQRPGDTILLPLERTASLLGCDPSLVRRHRAKLVQLGFLEEVEDYIPHKKAKRYQVGKLPSE